MKRDLLLGKTFYCNGVPFKIKGVCSYIHNTVYVDYIKENEIYSVKKINQLLKNKTIQ